MNKRQLEVQKAQVADEAKTIRELKQVYAQARKDCEAKIAELNSRTDMQNIQAIVYQKQYQEALKKQIEGILDTLQSNQFKTISDYLGVSYENGFFGTLYDLQGQGIPLIFPINQEEVVQALQVDSKLSQGLYKRLGEDTDYLKKSIRVELSRGAANGSSWLETAAKIATGMNSPFNKAYNNALRIARTEGHRVQQQAQWNTLQTAKEKGADIVKQWDSTLDNRTRNDHKILDGQIRELDDYFEVGGYKAMYPGSFGVASEDIHCRCCMLQRAKWALDEDELHALEKRAAHFGLDKTKDFDEFKEKYLQLSENADTMKIKFPDEIYKVSGLTPKVKEELDTALINLKSEYDIWINSIVVEKAGKGDIFATGYHDGVMDVVVNEDADFDRIIDSIDYNYRTNRFAGKSLEDYVAHEMAHVMLYQDCTTDAEYRAKYKQIESLYSSLCGVSRYADRTKSGNEALAEAFVRVRNKENVKPIVNVLVKSYFDRWKK